jgi:hypothetical protein
MTKSRGIYTTCNHWTPEDDAKVIALYPDMPTADLAGLLGRKVGSVYQAATRLKVSKSDAFNASEASGRILKGATEVGLSGRFQKGHETWNKGTHFVAGGRSAQTRFRKGQTPHNEQPIGALRISSENMLERKMNNNKGANHVRWIPVSRLVWEAAHGKVPPNHFVIFKPGMRTTELDKITLDKLECVTRAENARRNSIWRHGREMGALYQLKGAITRQVNRIAKQTKKTEL